MPLPEFLPFYIRVEFFLKELIARGRNQGSVWRKRTAVTIACKRY